MNIMNFNHLRAFYCVAKNRSFSIASEELHVSQPTISMQVKDLEQSYNIKLIKRGHKDLQLTEEGQIVYSHAKQIFSLTHNLQKLMADFSEKIIRIGSTPYIAHHILPNLLMILKESSPDMKVEIYTGLSTEILHMVLDSEYHVGVIGRLPYPETIVSKFITEKRLYYITKDPHLPSSLHLKDLQNCPIILPEKGSATREYIIGEFNKRNLPMSIYVECENPPAIKHMVHFGLGGAFFCLYDIEEDVRQRRFRKLNLLENLSVNYDLIYLKERKDSRIVEIFNTIMQRPDMSFGKHESMETKKTIPHPPGKKDLSPSL
jgi:LysR family transcriptional regulator, transcriptional activator of the cysJI operon